MNNRKFLSASWEYLAMFNYEIDPEILEEHLPPYTEPDLFHGKALISVVGFLFNKCRVLGIPWPGFTNFEEVNLRYYVKHYNGDKWERGVGFISEIVPSGIIAGIANTCYNEHYSKAVMKHNISKTADAVEATFTWKRKNEAWNYMRVTANNSLQEIPPGSAEEFILEHYVGYNKLKKDTTIAYHVQHPRWQVYEVTDHKLICDAEKLYGKSFARFINGQEPHSVFLAKGSDVTVSKPILINRAFKPKEKMIDCKAVSM